MTDEDPLVHALRKQEDHDFQPPLDVVDALDPLFAGLRAGTHATGLFFKDYASSGW